MYSIHYKKIRVSGNSENAWFSTVYPSPRTRTNSRSKRFSEKQQQTLRLRRRPVTRRTSSRMTKIPNGLATRVLYSLSRVWEPPRLPVVTGKGTETTRRGGTDDLSLSRVVVVAVSSCRRAMDERRKRRKSPISTKILPSTIQLTADNNEIAFIFTKPDTLFFQFFFRKHVY